MTRSLATTLALASALGASLSAEARAAVAPPVVDQERRTITYAQDPQPDRPWLGVLLDVTEEGLGILSVAPSSPAARAGLQPGDRVVRIEGRPVSELRGEAGFFEGHAVGDVVALAFVREGQEQVVDVRLGSRPDAPVDFRVPEGEPMPGLSMSLPKPSHAPLAARWTHRDKPRLGVTTGELSGQLARYFGLDDARGVLVESVQDDTPASRAALRAGDVITGIGGEPVGSTAALRRELDRFEEGERVVLDVVRDGRPITLNVFLDTPRPTPGPAPRGYLRLAPGTTATAVAVGADGLDRDEIERIVREAVEAAAAARDVDPAELSRRLADIDFVALAQRAAAGELDLDDLPAGVVVVAGEAPEPAAAAPTAKAPPAWSARTPTGAWIF